MILIAVALRIVVPMTTKTMTERIRECQKLKMNLVAMGKMLRIATSQRRVQQLQHGTLKIALRRSLTRNKRNVAVDAESMG